MKFFELWELYLRSKPLKPGTIRNYKYKEKKFESIWEREIEEITSLEIQVMYNNVKANLIQYDYDFVTLRSVFQFAIELNKIKENPVRMSLKRAIPSKTHELLTKEDILNLIYYLLSDRENEVKSTMLLVELLTGARISEVRAFQKKYIDTKKHSIVIKYQYQIIDESGKEGLTELKTQESKRLLYIPVLLREPLYRLIAPLCENQFVFSKNQKPISILSANLYLAKVCERLNLVKISTHTLRGLYATIAIYSGVNIFTISGQMGHSSLKETERYFKRMLRHDIESLGKIDGFLNDNKHTNSEKSSY